MTVVIVGGTLQARRLAAEVDGRGGRVVTTLAGRTEARAEVAGEVRIGGFGGVDEMREWLLGQDAGGIVDAAHPFAAAMHRRCAEVASAAGLPLIRLSRASWAERPESGDWTWAHSHAEAARAVTELPVLVTVGKQEAAAYAHLKGAVLRMTELPAVELGDNVEVVLQRGPFTVADERATFGRLGIRTLVTKDSGGEETSAKLVVATELGCDVIVIRRPSTPEVPSVTGVDEAVAWLEQHALIPPG